MTSLRHRRYSPAIDAMIDAFDGSAPWSSAMGMSFAVAEVAQAAGDYRPTETLGIRWNAYQVPDLATMADALTDDGTGPDIGFETAVLADAYLRGTVTDDDLDFAARVLARYLDRLQAAGLAD